MKCGFVFPRGSPGDAGELAYEAERAGWDGFFVWEPLWGFDAWVMLAAAAVRTSRIRLGTMITPVSRMRPWKLASETVALDHLSKGRLVLSVGLGAVDNGFEAFGEETDRKIRAELLDEGLDILTGLWRGQPFSYDGKHYKIRPTKFYPPPKPVQKPRIPLWVVGLWPSKKSMNRVLRFDGLIPSVRDSKGVVGRPEPRDVRAMAGFVKSKLGQEKPFDIIVEGRTPGGDPEKAKKVMEPWAEAGATWWTETMWGAMDLADPIAPVRKRIRQGPPKDFEETRALE